MEKVKERVNWCVDDEIYNVWNKVTGAIQIVNDKFKGEVEEG